MSVSLVSAWTAGNSTIRAGEGPGAGGLDDRDGTFAPAIHRRPFTTIRVPTILHSARSIECSFVLAPTTKALV
jgi:hypothetical protein